MNFDSWDNDELIWSIKDLQATILLYLQLFVGKDVVFWLVYDTSKEMRKNLFYWQYFLFLLQ